MNSDSLPQIQQYDSTPVALTSFGSDCVAVDE